MKQQDIDWSLGRKYGGLQPLNCVPINRSLHTERGKLDDPVSVGSESRWVWAPHNNAKPRARVGHVSLHSGHERLVIKGVAGVGKIRRQHRNTITEDSEAMALETRRPH